MSDCLFCKIVAKEIPAEIVYEDERSLAFLDIHPVNPGHVVVTAKEHSVMLFDTMHENWSAMANAIYLLAPKVRDAVSADGINIGMNNGGAAGQEIPHVHMHIMPRFSDDGHLHWLRTQYEGNGMKETGEKIRKAVSGE